MKKSFLILLISFTTYLSATKVAVAIKTTGNVSIHYAGEGNKQTLKPGSPLSSRDKIVTGKNGFALIMYLDDKTTLKILKNSTLEILGDRSDKTINKSPFDPFTSNWYEKIFSYFLHLDVMIIFQE